LSWVRALVYVRSRAFISASAFLSQEDKNPNHPPAAVAPSVGPVTVA
jgi:hypothetical protein